MSDHKASRGERRLSVLHAPMNFANQAWVVNEALRERGVDSNLLVYRWGDIEDKYNLPDVEIAKIRFTDWIGDEFKVLRDVIASPCDIVHFWNRSLIYTVGDGFFNGLDLPFLKAAGKRLVYRFTGYELRLKSLELECNPYSPIRYGFESRYDETAQREYVDFLRGYVDRLVVQDPEMQTYLPEATVIPRALILDDFVYREPERKQRPLVIHAPTDTLLKGSDFILKAIESLEDENGVEFDFKMITGLHHHEAMAWYAKADIIIDQILIGWYGVVSVEGMALGKTVIAYIRDDLLGRFNGEPPLLVANPDTITDVLRAAIKDFDCRRRMARAGRAYVEERHDSRKIAQSLETMYRDILRDDGNAARLPVFDYQVSQSEKLVRRINLGARAERHIAPQLKQTRETIREKETQLEQGGGHKADTVEGEDFDKDRRFEEAKDDHAWLRHKARQYDELKPKLGQMIADAEAYDRLAASPTLGKFFLTLKILPLITDGGAAPIEPWTELFPEGPDGPEADTDTAEESLERLRHDLRFYTEAEKEIFLLRFKAKKIDALESQLRYLKRRVWAYKKIARHPIYRLLIGKRFERKAL